MTRNFHRWEVDPFFQAAEEVQDSADRLESVYRAWLHAKSADACANDSIGLENHRRELNTALGTAKWQLEDFERAVSYVDADEQDVAAADNAHARHKQFVDALQNQITLIETSLLKLGDIRDLKALPAAHLCQEEKDSLALFLCGSKTNTQQDLKRSGYTSSTSSNGKGDDESFCTSSESVKSKNDVSDWFSTSPFDSDMALSRDNLQRLDHYSGPHELGWTDRNIKDCLNLEVHVDQSTKYFSDPAYKHLHVDKGRLSVGSESLQRQVYGSCNFSKASSTSLDRTRNKKESTNNLTCWLPFTKRLSAFDLRLSKSGLKRWKDGDANSRDHCVWHSHGSSDLENGEGSSFAGESSKGLYRCVVGGNVIGSIMFFNHWSKASSVLQHFIISRAVSPSIHKALGILVTLGVVGLVLFRVT
ncbi:hypothetical protein GOP47_0014656 [Adiantum capillus-veneris]|uniref:Syntaxin 6/10/61 N-terminal domain-containing protein n=1 Tax=Adiantum capillus-veneris TaxID=13818 RepID=A0A9D4ZCD4_ADICA|nr:hypothetical protein GOP47_0014656 [Adiantum capillus-veneris]